MTRLISLSNLGGPAFGRVTFQMILDDMKQENKHCSKNENTIFEIQIKNYEFHPISIIKASYHQYSVSPRHFLILFGRLNGIHVHYSAS